MIIVSTEKPAIYPRLAQMFGEDIWDRGVVITYGEKIHCKSGKLPLGILEHESVHVRQQQKMGKDLWWDKYLSKPKFRLEQELEAHKLEADFIRALHMHPRDRSSKIEYLAQSLSSNYQLPISYGEAKKLLS